MRTTPSEMDWLKNWARLAPRSPAIKNLDENTQYSYGDLYYLSCRLASHLKSRFGIKRGDRVAVMATNEMEFIPLFFAVQRLGAIFVPINFRLTAREVHHILSDSAADLLLYQSQFASTFKKVLTSLPLCPTWEFDDNAGVKDFIAAELATFRAEECIENIRLQPPAWSESFSGDGNSPCMILYTSGTTGAPKGAIITNDIIHWNSINTTLRLNLNQSDVTLSFLPFFHTGGWNVLLTPFIHRGACTLFMKKFDPQQVLELCEQEKVTILFGVPTTMEMMYRTPAFKECDLSSVRYAIVGGEPMSIQLIRAWQMKGVPIRQGYGLTEFGPNVFSLDEEESLRKIGSIGFPNFYVETRVVDKDDHEVEVGEIGELLLRGPMCTPGYWRNPEATAETIQNGWLRTGDLVRFDDEGFYYVAGRKKEMFISGGENVYPVEVEQFLSTHPAVSEVAVIGVPDDRWGEVGKAFVSLKSGGSASTEDLRSFCADALAKYKIPKYFEFLPELPKGDSGKILKRLLKTEPDESDQQLRRETRRSQEMAL